MGVTNVLFFVAVLTSSAALPVEEIGGERSPPPASVGSMDQSAESSELHLEAVAPPTEHENSEEVTSQEQMAASSNGFPEHSIELQGRHQAFFPSLANLFEPRQQSIRLGYNNQEGAYSQRPNSYRSLLNYPLFGGYRNLDNGFGKQQTSHAALVDANPGILGSGNFGIIKGGTFLAQNDGDDFDSFSAFYNNGHGRPSFNVGYATNPRPNYNEDQFANFRDFADINAPSNSAYSHFIVVYANKNATIGEVNEKTKSTLSDPKNIIETLELLDSTEPQPTKEPKVSKVKAKLAKTKLPGKKQYWKKSVKSQDFEEPLLALS